MDFPNAAVASYPKSMIRAPGTSCGRKSLGQKAPVAALVQVRKESPLRPWIITMLHAARRRRRSAAAVAKWARPGLGRGREESLLSGQIGNILRRKQHFQTSHLYCPWQRRVGPEMEMGETGQISSQGRDDAQLTHRVRLGICGLGAGQAGQGPLAD